MAVTTAVYSVYERLASAKMNSMVNQINAHTHGGTYGAPVDLTNATGILNIGAIPAGSITFALLDSLTFSPTGSIKLKDGYAVYAP